MKKIKSTILIQKWSLAYLALYLLLLLLLVSGNIGGSFHTAEGIVTYLLFILFIIGISISWFNKILTGTIFLLWNVGMWVLTLFIVKNSNGFAIVGGFPVFVLGVFFLLKGIEEKRKTPLKLIEKWRKSKTTSTLQILTGVFAALHFMLAVKLFSSGELSFLNPLGYLSIVSLLIVISCFALSWTRQKMVGIMLMVWNASVWIIDLLIISGAEEGEGMLTSPVMVLGAFFLLEWNKTSKATVPSEPQQWKFILRVLLINYAVLYSIVVLSELFRGDPVNYFSFPFIVFPLLLLIFLVGFLLSWKREILAGYIFLFWYVILVYVTFAYSEIIHEPWLILGLPILLQGIFYIKNHYQFRPK